MSILIEAFTLVFAQSRVNESYPGGVTAFIGDLRRSAIPIRHVIADDHLVGVSVRSLVDANAVADSIWQTMGVEPDSDRALGSEFWDQRAGWIRSGDWLDYAHHDDYTWISCWTAGTEPGELVAPENWTPDRTRRLECHLLTRLHGAICMCYSIECNVWVDAVAGESMPGFSLEPELTPEEAAEQNRVILEDDYEGPR